MTTITQKNIIPGVALAGAVAPYYTAPALTRARITNFTITNPTAGVIAFSAHIATGAAAAGAGNIKISARNIAPGETYCCPELVNRTLEPGDVVHLLGPALTADASAFIQQ